MATIKKDPFKCRRKANSSRCLKKIGNKECPVLFGGKLPKDVCRRFLRKKFFAGDCLLFCRDGEVILYRSDEPHSNARKIFHGYIVI